LTELNYNEKLVFCTLSSSGVVMRQNTKFRDLDLLSSSDKKVGGAYPDGSVRKSFCCALY